MRRVIIGITELQTSLAVPIQPWEAAIPPLPWQRECSGNVGGGSRGCASVLRPWLNLPWLCERPKLCQKHQNLEFNSLARPGAFQCPRRARPSLILLLLGRFPSSGLSHDPPEPPPAVPGEGLLSQLALQGFCGNPGLQRWLQRTLLFVHVLSS